MSSQMLRRIAAVLGLVLALWGGLALWQRAARDTPAGLTLPRLSAESVERVSFIRGADTVMLMRSGAEWRVNGLPAEARTVTEFLAASAESTAGSELVSQSAVSHQRLGVDSASALRLTVAGPAAGLDLLVGSRGPNFEGFYVRRVGETAAYLLHGPFVEAATRSADDWRDRLIAAIPAGDIGSVTVRRGPDSYMIQPRGSGWTVGGVSGDSTAVARYLGLFGDVRASGFPDAAQLAAIRFDPPELEVVVHDRSGKELQRLALAPAEGGFWVRSMAGVVYRMDSAAGGRIAPPAQALLAPR